MHHPLPSSRTGLQRRPEDYVFRIWHSVVQAKKCLLLPVNCRNCWYFSFHFRKGSASCGVANLSSNCVWIAMASLCIWICALVSSAWLSRIPYIGQAKRSWNACVATVAGSVISQTLGGCPLLFMVLWPQQLPNALGGSQGANSALPPG